MTRRCNAAASFGDALGRRLLPDYSSPLLSPLVNNRFHPLEKLGRRIKRSRRESSAPRARADLTKERWYTRRKLRAAVVKSLTDKPPPGAVSAVLPPAPAPPPSLPRGGSHWRRSAARHSRCVVRGDSGSGIGRSINARFDARRFDAPRFPMPPRPPGRLCIVVTPHW